MTSIAIDRRDGLSSATAVKGPCRVATTANISLSGTQTIDGVAVVADDRVLVKNQSTASENGIYVADTGSWSRAKDFSRNRDVQKGTQVYVTDGSVGSGQYRVTTSNPIEIGTTSIAFALAATGGGTVDSVNGQTGTVVLDAGDIASTPAGGVTASTVQAAIEELDTEKLSTTAAAAAYQPLDADLTALAGLVSAADKGIYFTGAATAATYDLTSFARTLLDDANASAARSTLGLAIGSDVQAYDAELAAIAGLTSAADRMPYFTGSGTAALATFTSFGRSLVDDADASAARTTIGVVIGTDVQAHDADLDSIAALSTTAAGRSVLTVADPNADRVVAWDDSAGAMAAIALADILTEAAPATGDYLLMYGAEGDLRKVDWSSLPGSGGGLSNAYSTITDGTTPASASGGDTFKLRAGTGLTVATQSNDVTHGDNALFSLDAELVALAGLTSAADKLPYFTGSGTAAVADFSAFGRSLVDDADAAAARTTIGLGNVDNTSDSTKDAAATTLTNKTITQPTLTLKQGTAPTPTAEGDIQWDTDDDVIVVGDGSAQKVFVALPASTAAGDLLYLSGAKVLSRLAKGTALQALRMNAGATAPEWAASGGGGLTLLETLTTTSGTTASTTASFSGYRKLYIEIDGVSFDGTVALRIAASTNNGSNYGSATAITANLPASSATITGWIEVGGIQIANANHGVIGSLGSTPAAVVSNNVNANSAAAITNLQFSPASGNFDAGAIRVYGLP